MAFRQRDAGRVAIPLAGDFLSASAFPELSDLDGPRSDMTINNPIRKTISRNRRERLMAWRMWAGVSGWGYS
jgi:hypothetical protein